MATRKLTNEQFGILIRAVFAYRFDGTEYSGEDPSVDTAFQFVASQIDRYRDICEAKAKAARDRWEVQKSREDDAEDTDGCTSMQEVQSDTPIQSYPVLSSPIPSDNKGSTADKLPTRHRFIPPTAEDVMQYCTEKGYAVDAQGFVDYYKSNGWKVGRNPMKDWKAAVRTWYRKDHPNGKAESNLSGRIGTVV